MSRLASAFMLTALLLSVGCASVPKSSATAASPAATVVLSADTPAPVAANDAAPPPTDVAAAEAAPPAQTPANTVASGSSADAAAPVAAEDDFDAIYGSTESGTATASSDRFAALDPWEKTNRRVHAFNTAIDRAFMRPVARAYVKVLPRPVRTGVSNVFDNLAAPLAFGNLLLQGRPREAVETLGRFLVNTIGGIGGIFDPATKALKMHRHSADFGRTLARWGWQTSRYVELPLLGPRTVRDALGAVGDISMAPMTYIEHDRTRLSLEALWLIDVRSGLLSLDDLRATAPDEYVLTRDAWLARRHYLVEADRSARDEGNESLPAYLLEDGGSP